MLIEDVLLAQISPFTFHNALFLGPERLERCQRGKDVMQDFRKEEAKDETYQKAFDRLQNGIAAAEREGSGSAFITLPLQKR